MVISRQHKYVFIEIPLTGSWAIRNELIKYYQGEAILHKHATYEEYASQASDVERAYFVLATVRHPLDEAVSRYFKLKTDHRGAFTDPEALSALKSDEADRRKYDYVQRADVTFEEYFKQYHSRPFNNMLTLSERRLDFVMRFEQLQSDFARALEQLNLQAQRPVPVVNKTTQRRADWRSYYTPAIIPQAKKKFGPFMRKWAYTFPSEWGESHVGWREEAWFRAWSAGQRVYVRYFRYNASTAGRVGRALRARLIR